jgi:hypothetical protein
MMDLPRNRFLRKLPWEVMEIPWISLTNGQVARTDFDWWLRASSVELHGLDSSHHRALRQLKSRHSHRQDQRSAFRFDSSRFFADRL